MKLVFSIYHKGDDNWMMKSTLPKDQLKQLLLSLVDDLSDSCEQCGCDAHDDKSSEI